MSSIKDDLLFTVKLFASWTQFSKQALKSRCKAANDLSLEHLFFDYIMEHKEADNTVSILTTNPLMHMLQHTPTISCFFKGGGWNIHRTWFLLDSRKHINYIILDKNVPIEFIQELSLKFYYPDSIMLAWASGELPKVLARYLPDIHQVLYGGKQNLSSD